MALLKPQRSVFLDSSVLYAAAFSATGPARRLILKGFQGSVTLCISDLVLAETKRNLSKNAPAALPCLTIIVDLLAPYVIRPTKAEVLKASQIVHLKDAPILQSLNKGKDTRGFLFCKPKMYSLVPRSGLPIHFPILKNFL
jgi:hypothetical protein